MATLAIFGLNGAIGPHAIEALTSATFSSKVKFPLRLFTGKDKPANTSEKEYFNYKDDAEVAKGLEGVDILIDLRAGGASDLGAAAKKAGIKLYLLSEYGSNYEGTRFTSVPAFQGKIAYKKKIQEYGIKTSEIITSFFADWVWGEPLALGVSIAQQTVLAPNKDKKTSVTFLSDLGKVIASVVTKPIDEIKPRILVHSDVVTTGKVASYYEKASGKTLKDAPLTEEQWIEKSDEAVAGNGPAWSFLWIIGAVNVTTEQGAYFAHPDNDYVNPGLFEWTKFEPEALKAWSKQ